MAWGLKRLTAPSGLAMNITMSWLKRKLSKILGRFPSVALFLAVTVLPTCD